ncbi:hypothetical protein [Geopsychrobacter electrodiphilus]|uniref:hypothetical protein n=1 Tax=Geopsychrobacter electrodiphilus TaxID=225196 RepID=UPI00036A3D24|nr:hypothetical protein [Geopsychrobacter electrodiphilus]
MDLGEVLKTYLSDNQQGQLVIKFVGEDHLCKISIEDGQAVYLALGTKGPAETLNAITGKIAEWSNFLKGLPARKRLDAPLNQKLFEMAGGAPLAENDISLAVSAETTVAVADELVVDEKMIDVDQISAMNTRFIDLVGPFGTILIEKIYINLAYTSNTPMSSATYTRFIAALTAEIADSDRAAFIDAATQ